jgi:hypothetical protein
MTVVDVGLVSPQWTVTSAGWDLVEGSATPTYSTLTQRFTGSPSLVLTNGAVAGRVARDITATDTVTVGFAFSYAGNTGTVRHIATLGTGTTDRVRVQSVIATGVVQVVKASDGTVLLETGEAILSSSTSVWNYITLQVFRHATAGTITLTVHPDGGAANETAVTNVDTADGSTSGYDRVSWLSKDPSSTSGTTRSSRVRDMFIDNELIYRGSCRTIVKRPSTQGDHDDWTPSTGTDKPALIDNTPNNDTELISSSTNGHRDSWNMTALTADTGRPYVHAVQAYLRAASDGPDVTFLTRRSSSDQVESTVSPGVSVGTHRSAVQNVDPHTAAVWSKTDVDGTQWGVRADV